MRNRIFILGVGRTGSQMMMNVLNKHSKIFIDNEINFLLRFKRDIVSEVKKIGDLKNDDNVLRLVNILYSDKIRRDYPIMGKIPKEEFKEKFLSSDRSLKSLFALIIDLKADLENKEISGAKFPVHFSYLTLLHSWFPEAKIIFLTRDPRAIYASELEMKKRRTYESQFPIRDKSPFYRLAVMSYVIVQWIWAQRIYFKYRKKYNLYLSKYEEFVQHPEVSIKKICNYIGVDYEPSMLDIMVQDSSHEKEKKKGINTSTIDKWKHKLNKFEKAAISAFTFLQRRKIGY